MVMIVAPVILGEGDGPQRGGHWAAGQDWLHSVQAAPAAQSKQERKVYREFPLRRRI